MRSYEKGIDWKTVAICMLSSVLASLLCCTVLFASLMIRGNDREGSESGFSEKQGGSAFVSCTEAPVQEETADTVLPESSDTDPVDALFELIATGDMSLAERAFHPETLKKLGGIIDMLPKSLNAEAFMRRLIHKGFLFGEWIDLEKKYEISYDLLAREIIEGAKLDAIRERYLSGNYSAIPEEARKLTVRVILKTGDGEKTFELMPIVVKCSERWYIDLETVQG